MAMCARAHLGLISNGTRTRLKYVLIGDASARARLGLVYNVRRDDRDT
jgi:hypothetical protein